MRWTAAVLVIGACGSGCNVAYYAAHNVVNDPKLEVGEHKFRSRMRAAAHEAWKKERSRYGECQKSHAFRDGFVDGFVDHMVEGGVPYTPSMPPPEYRRHANDYSGDGQVKQSHYLAGFLQGGLVAVERGGRESTLVTLAVPVAQPEKPLSITAMESSHSNATATHESSSQPKSDTLPENMPPATPPGPPVPMIELPPTGTPTPATPMIPVKPTSLQPSTRPKTIPPPRVLTSALIQTNYSTTIDPIQPPAFEPPASEAALWGRIPYRTLAQVPAVSFWGPRK